MKTQIQSCLLLSVAALLVRAQISSEPSYQDILSGLFASGDVEGCDFHPLIEDLQVDTLSSAEKSLSFVARETLCSGPQKQQGLPCPLKQNGQILSCNLVVSHSDHDASKIDTSKMVCQPMEKEDALKHKIRMRRSKAGKGSGGGGGSGGGSRGGGRPGGGSSIGGGGNRGNGGTQTA